VPGHRAAVLIAGAPVLSQRLLWRDGRRNRRWARGSTAEVKIHWERNSENCVCQERNFRKFVHFERSELTLTERYKKRNAATNDNENFLRSGIRAYATPRHSVLVALHTVVGCRRNFLSCPQLGWPYGTGCVTISNSNLTRNRSTGTFPAEQQLPLLLLSKSLCECS